MKKKIELYSPFERFWHWSQTILVIFLMVTGFEIHNSYSFLGWQNAVVWHNIAAWLLMILLAFTLFWDILTGEWKQYIPTRKNITAQLNYYLFGIFKNAAHPVKKTKLSKLNPLQRIVYFMVKFLAIPAQLITGLLYMYYLYPNNPIEIGGLEVTAIIHTAFSFLLVAFLVVHLYLITTGHTIWSNLRAMIVGYERLEDEDQTEEDQTEEDVSC